MNEYAKKYVCIKKDKEFRFLFKKGDSIVTDAFVCYARESKRRVNRIGIVTGKKVGNAVKRSRARRVIREAFRLIEPLLREKTQKRYDFIFVARAKTPAMKSTEVYLWMEKQLMKRYAIRRHSMGLLSPKLTTGTRQAWQRRQGFYRYLNVAALPCSLILTPPDDEQSPGIFHLQEDFE